MTPFVEFLDHINSNQQQVLQAARLLQSMKIATAELVAEAEAWCSASPPPVLSSAAFAPYPLRNPAKSVVLDSSAPVLTITCIGHASTVTGKV